MTDGERERILERAISGWQPPLSAPKTTFNYLLPSFINYLKNSGSNKTFSIRQAACMLQLYSTYTENCYCFMRMWEDTTPSINLSEQLYKKGGFRWGTIYFFSVEGSALNWFKKR